MSNTIASQLFAAEQPFLSQEDAEAKAGPLIFAPKPNSSTTLIQTPEIALHLPPPYPFLPLSRFLQKHDCFYSSAASISSLLGPQIPEYSHYHGFNTLQLLQIPNCKIAVAFFPSGKNSDVVAFSILTTAYGTLQVLPQGGNPFSVVKEGNRNRHRITRLLVIPWEKAEAHPDIAGSLMVCTNYSVYWYSIRIRSHKSYSCCLDYLGCADPKALLGKSVVSSCWSPHFREESLLVLENGDLLMFSLDISSQKNSVVKKIFHISLSRKLKLAVDDNRKWFGCEFSWHPRLFVVFHDHEVFLISCMLEGVVTVSSLLKLEIVSDAENDAFLALAMVDSSDGHCYAVATRRKLFLCHAGKPNKLMLEWEHKLDNPRYMIVSRLSNLRADEMGHYIMLGSFWDDKFRVFRYGQDSYEMEGTVMAGFYNTYCSWGLPFDLPLLDSKCECGSCLLRSDFARDSLPVWIDWRQRENPVSGFAVLDSDLSKNLSSPENGFVLIVLTSSGCLHAQPFGAITESEKVSGAVHKRKSSSSSSDHIHQHLYDSTGSEYRGNSKYCHLKFEFLTAYLNGNLADLILEKKPKRKNIHDGDDVCPKREEGFFSGTPKLLNDISLPVSIKEIALKSFYSELREHPLKLSFSKHSDHDDDSDDDDSFEFLNVPNQNQDDDEAYPFRTPSIQSNKWSKKVQLKDSLIGPLLPPQFLLAYRRIDGGSDLEEEPDSHLELICDEVVKAILRRHDDDQSLGSEHPKFCYHRPPTASSRQGKNDDAFSTFVFRRRASSEGSDEVLNFGCPVEVKFRSVASSANDSLGAEGMETLRGLNKLNQDFQEGFKPYREYINRLEEPGGA
ncbi:hypothetical protein M569_00424 [Genlisea aurea]|uniref:Uncharacterized protein n=1 Tax=Genlisea aurea TaxID=192259 RepID=S8EEH2_9LAMI|nr:hypothetical protein M569_00424 [Genlisea aurea]